MRKAQSFEQTVSIDKVDIIAVKRTVNVKPLRGEFVRKRGGLL